MCNIPDSKTQDRLSFLREPSQVYDLDKCVNLTMQSDAFVHHSIFTRVECFMAVDHVAVSTMITVQKAPLSASGLYSCSTAWFERISAVRKTRMGALTALVFFNQFYYMS